MDGSPLPGAEVSIWQAGVMSIEEKDLVASGLRADQRGVLELPPQDSLEPTDVTTATGHTLRKWNPWGRIDVVGTNTTLFLQVDAAGQRDYAFVRVHPYNRAFWQGHRDSYALPIHLAICPDGLDVSLNLASGAQVSSSHGTDRVEALTDGDLLVSWDGGQARAGDWLQFDLGEPREVGALRVYQSEAHGEFFQRFRVEVSNDPTFASEAQMLAEQGPEGFRWAMHNRKDILPEAPTVRRVTYTAAPLRGRYVRITALEGGRALLSEVEALGP